MRFALAAALLIICLCSQGCLSFRHLGKLPPGPQNATTVVTFVTGIASIGLGVAGMACLAVGYKIDADDSGPTPEAMNCYTAGLVLLLSGFAHAIVSSILRRYCDTPIPSQSRGKPAPNSGTMAEYGSLVPDRFGGQSIVGLPALGHIDPRKLHIQRVNWYWIQQE